MNVQAKDLQPGDTFHVGGVSRTVEEVTDHGDNTVTVLYSPGWGLRKVPSTLTLRGVTR